MPSRTRDERRSLFVQPRSTQAVEKQQRKQREQAQFRAELVREQYLQRNGIVRGWRGCKSSRAAGNC